MHHYKIVLLDHRYHVRSVEEIDFETDEIACERAKTLYGERAPHAVAVSYTHLTLPTNREV